MKKIAFMITPIIASIFFCSIFMDISGDDNDLPVISEVHSIKQFQTGTYNTLEEAEKEASLKKGIVIKVGENYQVIVGILKNNSNIERMIKYLEEKNTYYYIKDINVDPAFTEILNKYEDLMINSTSSVAFLQLNKKILERYKILYES